MILKRLGIGKKSEYFLEAEPLSPDEMKAHTESVASAPVKTAVPVVVSESSAAEPSPETIKPAKTTQKKVKKAKAEDSAALSSAPSVPKPAPKPEPIVVNFATNYLLQQTNTPRRRPGPSLDMFKDMAKQVNSRK
jgi:hypothetical protein